MGALEWDGGEDWQEKKGGGWKDQRKMRVGDGVERTVAVVEGQEWEEEEVCMWVSAWGFNFGLRRGRVGAQLKGKQLLPMFRQDALVVFMALSFKLVYREPSFQSHAAENHSLQYMQLHCWQNSIAWCLPNCTCFSL